MSGVRISSVAAHIVAPNPGGFDSDNDHVIDFRKNELFRFDSRGQGWDMTRLAIKADHFGNHDSLIQKGEVSKYLKRFDRNHDGVLSTRNHEFQRAYNSLFSGFAVPKTPKVTSFERKLRS